MLVGLLVGAAAGGVEGEATDTEAPADAAVSDCVARCEATHDTCTAAATAQAADCARQTKACNDRCSLCTRMYGPLVVSCVEDCQGCQAKLAAPPCAHGDDAGKACETALEGCLERCGE
jgi:hypothetical protein